MYFRAYFHVKVLPLQRMTIPPPTRETPIATDTRMNSPATRRPISNEPPDVVTASTIPPGPRRNPLATSVESSSNPWRPPTNTREKQATSTATALYTLIWLKRERNDPLLFSCLNTP